MCSGRYNGGHLDGLVWLCVDVHSLCFGAAVSPYTRKKGETATTKATKTIGQLKRTQTEKKMAQMAQMADMLAEHEVMFLEKRYYDMNSNDDMLYVQVFRFRDRDYKRGDIFTTTKSKITGRIHDIVKNGDTANKSLRLQLLVWTSIIPDVTEIPLVGMQTVKAATWDTAEDDPEETEEITQADVDGAIDFAKYLLNKRNIEGLEATIEKLTTEAEAKDARIAELEGEANKKGSADVEPEQAAPIAAEVEKAVAEEAGDVSVKHSPPCCMFCDGPSIKSRMFIYGIGISGAVCAECVTEMYEVCSLCGLFQSKEDRISHDPWINEAHRFKPHDWITWSPAFTAENQFDI